MRIALPLLFFLGALIGFPAATQFVPVELHPTITSMFAVMFLAVVGASFAFVAHRRRGTFLSQFSTLCAVIAFGVTWMIPNTGGDVSMFGSLVTYLFAIIGGTSLVWVVVTMYDGINS